MNIVKSFLYAYSKNTFLKISIAVMITIVISFGIVTKSNDLGEDWKNQVNIENINYAESLASPYVTPYIETEFTSSLHENEAYIENDINPDSNNAWEFFYTQLDFLFVITIVICILLITYQDNERDKLLIKDLKKMYFNRLYSYVFLYIFLLIVVLIISFMVGVLLWPNTLFDHEYFSYYNGVVSLSSFMIDSMVKVILISITSINYIVHKQTVTFIFYNRSEIP